LAGRGFENETGLFNPGDPGGDNPFPLFAMAGKGERGREGGKGALRGDDPISL
jgi:hypothetical protein